MHSLPIDPLLPEIVGILQREPSLVLEAPPGAGKTTRVPRALLDAGAPGEIVVLEPRRLAARLAARRVAEELGEMPGETVGYQVRFEDVTGPKTRLRFVTEAILTRRFVRDPELVGVSTVVLDEFHERHLHGDVALAYLRHLQQTSRPDLRLVLMSATLDAEPAARFLGCRSLRSEGKRFDVRIEHAEQIDDRPLELQVASAVRNLTADTPGDVLVFLPGAREIRRAQEALEKLATERQLLVLPLHGDLSVAEQDRAIRPAERPKVILATNVAESSVTIDGVIAVVDSGLARVMGHDPWSGLPRLRIEKVSRASATQRAGRAGRTRPGTCVRLYTKIDFERRPEHQPPEIARLDLAELLLELRARKVDRDLTWLDAPPPVALAAAEDLLTRLGAIEAVKAIAAGGPGETGKVGDVTAIGHRMLRFPLHPRTARVLVEAEDRGVFDDAAVLAALLGERDVRAAGRARFDRGRATHDVATEDSDLLQMLDLFREAQETRFAPNIVRAIGLDPGATSAVDRAQKQLRRIGRTKSGQPVSRDHDVDLRKCILSGYPDRVARRVRGRTLAMAGDGRAELSESSVVRDAPWLVAVDGDEKSVRIASAIEPDWLIEFFADRVVETTRTTFVRAAERVESVGLMTYEGLVLDESPANRTDDARAAELLAEAVLADGMAGLARFAPEGALEAWVARARFAHTVDAAIPLVDDAFLREVLLEQCTGRRSFAELRAMSFVDAIQSRLGPAHTARIFTLAPERITLAAGRSVKIRYEAENTPHIASRLQDFFGMNETPRVGGGKIALVVHLLAPNQRAVQVTSDLKGFWERHYPALRKQLSRKYPKHAWPERPEN